MFLKKMTKLTYLITFENPEVNGIMGEFEEALILVGRLIERLSNEEDNIGKYIYISEYVLNDDGNYIKQDYLQRYLIKKDL
jgi:hypothetical protein